ncbi:MAG: conserved hypothetical membrane protein [Marine Group I thaumarchaeote]|nr:MAG: conserved hypothetical membrane protein [Marine Group I thaumarchaeote]
MYPERPRSNWWYLLPILFSIIGGVISYFVIKNDDLKKAKNCLCVGLVLSFGLIGGIISYFVLRKDDPKKAKIFLYVGIVLAIIGIAINVTFGTQLMELDPEFVVNI